MLSGYELSDCVGKTTDSKVYRALQCSDLTPVILRIPADDGPQHHAEFRREFEFLRNMRISGLLDPIRLASDNSQPAMVLQDCPGTVLKSMLIERRLELRAGLQIACSLAHTLAGLHSAGFVHQDVRPANILVSETDWSTCILDCSVCSGAVTSEARERNWAYISPEQTGRTKRPIDQRTDLYALGVLLYHMLTGRLPFKAADALEWAHSHIARLPVSPSDLVPSLPGVVSAIVLKLLAKAPEHRYQSAQGLQHDLRECIAQLDRSGTIRDFPLAARDVSEQFTPSHKLYGREAPRRKLLDTFQRVAGSGVPEIVLISGEAGIGKSSLVHEAQSEFLLSGARFIEGKFDQHKREVPYSTLTQAFRDLVGQILTESDERIALWREQLKQALGDNGQLIVQVIPELADIIGPQPSVPEVPPDAAQNRFRRVFRSFIGVFTKREHPLVLFLDDVQWVDPGSLALAAQLMTPCKDCFLLLVAAYRDNEVPATAEMNSVLNGLREAGTRITHLRLGPLQEQEVDQLLADSLHRDPQECAPLGQLVTAKTQGNPFFVLQFLTALHDRQLVRFDPTARRWIWDTSAVSAENLTENVADLMARRLHRLSGPAQQTLQLAACLGDEFDLATLAVVAQLSQSQTASHLDEAVEAGIIAHTGRLSCRFLHDRLREAVYSLVPENARPETHLRIGRLMLADWPAHTISERLFDVVNQFSRGAQAATDERERQRIRQLQFTAGQRARSEGAFVSARGYFSDAAALLPTDAWRTDYGDAYSTYLELAECENLAGGFEAAEEFFQVLLANAQSDLDGANVCRLRVNTYPVAGHYYGAVEACLEGLRLLGITVPRNREEIERDTRLELKAIESNLQGRSVQQIADAELSNEPRHRVVVALLVDVLPAAWIAWQEAYVLLTAKAVNLSLKFGNTDESAQAYGFLAVAFAATLGNPRLGREYSEMALQLNERAGGARFRGRLLMIHGAGVLHWSRHIPATYAYIERALYACLEAGDFEYAGFAAQSLPWIKYHSGEPLDTVLRTCLDCGAVAEEIHNDSSRQTIRVEQQFVAALKGWTRREASLEDENFDESEYLSRMKDSGYRAGIGIHAISCLILSFIFGRYEDALEYALREQAVAPELIEAVRSFFLGLTLAALYPDAAEARQREFAQTLLGLQAKLKDWAANCPENFQSWHALLTAEVARIEFRELDAERFYEQAIQSARDSGFIHYQAIATELASRFYRARGLSRIADTYLKEACSLYRRWGADTKVAQLEAMWPELRESAKAPSVGEQLDAVAVVRASRAISSQIELDQLLRTLLNIVLQSAGAQRACLFLADGQLMNLVATGTADPTNTNVLVRGDAGFPDQAVPLSVVDYVRHTKKKVVLDQDSPAGPFSSDRYLLNTRPKSLLCLPLLNQAELRGLLYLENHLVSQAFTPERLAMLEAIAAQAAISLHNAQLFALLQGENTERKKAEEHLRRSEALLAQGEGLSHTGSVYRNLVTGERHWSDEFCRLLGYEPGIQGSIDAFLSRVHPDDRAEFNLQDEDLARWKTDQERHFRLALPGGSIRYVHNINRPVLNEAGVTVAVHGVVVDETDRKRTELLREGEARVLEMIARSAPLSDVLNELVRVIEAQADGMLCTVLLLDEDGVHIRHGASPSLPASYTDPIDGERIGPRHGSCGTAAYRGETVIVTDIATDPLWENWRDLALAHGLRACWSAPIFSSEGKVLGTFAMYYREPRSPRAAEVHLLQLATHLAGIAIERRRMETDLVESRNEVQQIMASISDSVWSADVSPQGEIRFRYSSPVIESITGRPAEFFMQSPQHWISMVHPEDRGSVEQRMQESALHHRAVPEAEYRIVLPDGSVRWIRDSVRAAPLEGGGLRVHGVLSDITERKRAEESLRHSRELLQSVMDGAEAVIYVKDLEGRYLLTNRRFWQLVRLSPDEIVGKTDYDLYPHAQAAAFRQADTQAASTRQPVEVEETATGSDGTPRTFISIKGPLLDNDGEPYAICGVSTEITERKRLEEQLREAQKMEAIGKLAGGIAHDFNNLMTIVTGYSELLQGALTDNQNLREKADEIHKAGEQAASLTRQLLAFSRRQVLQTRLLDLNEVLSGMSKMMRRLLRDDIELVVITDPSLPPIRSDSAQIQQVIMNLIINARDAMPDGGTITIATGAADCEDARSPLTSSHSGRCVRLCVSDTGHGMPPEVREHIFEPFFTTKEQGRGTGLGLATVHGIVQQAGGRVVVESEQGKGTTFNIYLPVAEGEVSPKPLQMPRPERGGAETILVVEDQEGLRTLITEILRAHGYHVVTASNGREALGVLGSHSGRIDLMITDLVMPQMGGRALAAALPDFHPETMVVYMSGYVENLDELLAPGHTFIEKPFAPESLLRIVREVLDKRAKLARPA